MQHQGMSSLLIKVNGFKSKKKTFSLLYSLLVICAVTDDDICSFVFSNLYGIGPKAFYCINDKKIHQV